MSQEYPGTSSESFDDWSVGEELFMLGVDCEEVYEFLAEFSPYSEIGTPSAARELLMRKTDSVADWLDVLRDGRLIKRRELRVANRIVDQAREAINDPRNLEPFTVDYLDLRGESAKSWESLIEAFDGYFEDATRFFYGSGIFTARCSFCAKMVSLGLTTPNDDGSVELENFLEALISLYPQELMRTGRSYLAHLEAAEWRSDPELAAESGELIELLEGLGGELGSTIHAPIETNEDLLRTAEAIQAMCEAVMSEFGTAI